jgi:hypothetical protein
MVKKGLLLNLFEGLVTPKAPPMSPFLGEAYVVCNVLSKLRLGLLCENMFFFMLSCCWIKDLFLGEPLSLLFLFSSSIVYHFLVVKSKEARSFIS